MSTRHTFAAALVLLLLTAGLLPLALAQDKNADPFDPFAPESKESAKDRKKAIADAANRQAEEEAAACAKLEAETPGDAKVPCRGIPPDASPRERLIYRALSRRVEIEFTEIPLKEAVQYIESKYCIDIEFDEKALTESAVATDQPVNIRLEGVSLRAALRHMLRPQQLTYTIRDSVLLITSQSDAENVLVVRTHPVGDLVTDANGRTDFVPLIELMGHIVAPTTWDEVGGPGSVQSLEPGMLVISQTDEVQAELEGLFTTLRQVRDLQKKSPGGAPVALRRLADASDPRSTRPHHIA